MKLTLIRKKINKIDDKLIKLLRTRSLLIPKVKRIKTSWLYKVAFLREFSMAEKLNKKDFGLYPTTYMQKIWREIISATLYIECQLTIHVYNKNNNYGLWELTKDHFGSFSNLILHPNYENLFQYLAKGQTECIILPYPHANAEKWWLELLKPAYKGLRINLELPYLTKIKTFGKVQGMCLSRNIKDVSCFSFYIIKFHNQSPLLDNITILDNNEEYIFIKTTYTMPILQQHFQVATQDIHYVGSTPQPLT